MSAGVDSERLSAARAIASAAKRKSEHDPLDSSSLNSLLVRHRSCRLDDSCATLATRDNLAMARRYTAMSQRTNYSPCSTSRSMVVAAFFFGVRPEPDLRCSARRPYDSLAVTRRRDL